MNLGWNKSVKISASPGTHEAEWADKFYNIAQTLRNVINTISESRWPGTYATNFLLSMATYRDSHADFSSTYRPHTGWIVCGRYVAGIWTVCGLVLYVAGMWPVCGRYAAGMWPVCGFICIWSVCGRYVAGMWPVCGSVLYVAGMRPTKPST